MLGRIPQAMKSIFQELQSLHRTWPVYFEAWFHRGKVRFEAGFALLSDRSLLIPVLNTVYTALAAINHSTVKCWHEMEFVRLTNRRSAAFCLC